MNKTSAGRSHPVGMALVWRFYLQCVESQGRACAVGRRLTCPEKCLIGENTSHMPLDRAVLCVNEQRRKLELTVTVTNENDRATYLWNGKQPDLLYNMVSLPVVSDRPRQRSGYVFSFR